MTDNFYTEKKIKVNPLFKVFRQTKEHMIETEDVINQNLTDEFWEFIEFQIKNKKLINIAVVGEVAHGKSVVAMKVCLMIIKEINKYIKRKIDQRKMDIDKICSDQLEFSRKAHDELNSNTCFVIDEDNKMSYVGANATTEKARLQAFSEIQAQRYIHRCYCSPSTVADDQSTVILQVINYDVEEHFTRFQIWYKNNEPYGEDLRVIGFGDVETSEVLKADWYKKYVKKKFKKMNLINDLGIDDIRAFEEATIIIKMYEENKNLARYQVMKISDLNLAVKQTVRENKSRSSLIMKEEFIRDIKSILDNVYYQQKEKIKLNKFKEEIKKKEEKESLNVYEIFADTYILLKYELKEKINERVDAYMIEKLFDVNIIDSSKIFNIILKIVEDGKKVNKTVKEELKNKSYLYDRLLGIILYKYSLITKLARDLAYYKKIKDGYQEYLNIE